MPRNETREKLGRRLILGTLISILSIVIFFSSRCEHCLHEQLRNHQAVQSVTAEVQHIATDSDLLRVGVSHRNSGLVH